MKTIEMSGHKVEIDYDQMADSPREWENLGTMICFHRRYTLGDKHGLDASSFEGWEDMQAHLEKEYDGVLLPVYMYDHSGIALSTGSFGCPWDSGQVGFIGCSKADIRKWYQIKRITKKTAQRAEEALRQEVETYSKYVNGEVYHVRITTLDGEYVDSCGGFYSEEDVIEHAKEFLKLVERNP